MNAIRWSGNDRYFGPFTYARERNSKLAVMLGSGDGDDYPGCRLRLSVGRHTFIVALPQIIKPWRKKVYPGAAWDAATVARLGRDWYYDTHEREFGFSVWDGALHVHYGKQTNEWPGSKSKVFFYPWREHRSIRHSLYDLEGEHFADLPEWGFRHKNGWAVKEAIEAACPVARFEFADFDGERIVATTRIEEREWKRGKGLFHLLYIGRNRIGRSLDLRFSAEVGKRKGSWKGGTIGHSITMRPGELHEAAFRRYCAENNLTFVGAASAIEARSAETGNTDSARKGESAVPQADAK
jgi:hypothetical protein